MSKLDILILLKEADKPLTQRDISAQLGLSRSTAAHQLRYLCRDKQVISYKGEGAVPYTYTLPIPQTVPQTPALHTTPVTP